MDPKPETTIQGLTKTEIEPPAGDDQSVTGEHPGVTDLGPGLTAILRQDATTDPTKTKAATDPGSPVDSDASDEEVIDQTGLPEEDPILRDSLESILGSPSRAQNDADDLVSIVGTLFEKSCGDKRKSKKRRPKKKKKDDVETSWPPSGESVKTPRRSGRIGRMIEQVENGADPAEIARKLLG